MFLLQTNDFFDKHFQPVSTALEIHLVDYFPAKYIFSLQFRILISRQNYRLQTRDITPCGWVPLIWKITKTN